MKTSDNLSCSFVAKRKKEEISLIVMTKALAPQKSPKSTVTTQKRHQNFDYTTIADRPRIISWVDDSHPTGVVKQVYPA